MNVKNNVKIRRYSRFWEQIVAIFKKLLLEAGMQCVVGDFTMVQCKEKEKGEGMGKKR